MRKLPFLILCTALMAGPALSQDSPPEEIPIDRIVAVVNDGVILKSELDRAVAQVKARLQGKVALPPEDIVRRQVLERLLLNKLQLQLAEHNGVQVSANEVDEALERMARRNNMTLAQLRGQIISGDYSFSSFRDDMHDQLIIQKLQERVVDARVQVSDSEVRIQLAKLPDQNKAYHLGMIMISVPEGADRDTVQAAAMEARNLYRKLRGGASFSQAAIAQSDARNALQGGDLGWLRAEEIPPDFIEVVQGLDPGEIAPPLQAPGGFYLIQLQDVREAQPVMVQEKHARHILIKPDGLTSDQEAYRQIVELRQRIVEGQAEFAEVARQHSDDIVTGSQGGDLGWFGPRAHGSQIDQVLAKLEPGEISQPFRTNAGWHIIQLLEHRTSDRTEELRSQRARQAIFERKRGEQIERWLRQMRAEAYVDIRL